MECKKVVDKTDISGRVVELDVLKSILIISVVIGHTDTGIALLNQIIYWFHMPCFFIISGFLYKERAEMSIVEYIKVLFSKYLIPYFVFYYLFSTLNCDFRIKHLLGAFYGGRAVAGVYWYINCLLLCEICLWLTLKYFGKRSVLKYAVASWALGTIWSLLLKLCTQLRQIAIPWNADVAFLAFFFFSIGFLLKNSGFYMHKKNAELRQITDVGSAVIVCIAVVWSLKNGDPFSTDMKYVNYGGGNLDSSRIVNFCCTIQDFRNDLQVDAWC